MLGPYIKSRGTRATEMSSNAALITMETYVQQGETIWKPVFSDTSQNVQINVYFGLFRGPLGGLQWSDWPYLAFQLSSHPYPCTCQIRKQSEKKFLSLNPKYEKIYGLFFIFGGLGGPYIEPRWTKFSGQQALHDTEQTYV